MQLTFIFYFVKCSKENLCIFKGDKAATDEEWNRLRFMLEMKKLNVKDFWGMKLKVALYE